MFPHLFEEMAQSRNDIDWATLLRSSPELGRLVYKELVEGQNAFNEFIDVSNMKSELDSFFALASDTKRPTRPWVKTGAIKLRQGSPTAFNLMHKSAYYAQKWLGKLQAPLSFDRVILRLLILKVWGDLFLNYPVPKLSDSSQLI
jgi:hypothetical protein